MTERATVRLGIPALFLASTVGAVAVSLHTSKSAIPGFAFGSHVVLAVQLALLFFYAALLLLVPLMRALFNDELPIELSLKGARWTEGIDDLGMKLTDRQAIAEKDALTETAELQREIETLRNILEEVAGYHGPHGDK